MVATLIAIKFRVRCRGEFYGKVIQAMSSISGNLCTCNRRAGNGNINGDCSVMMCGKCRRYGDLRARAPVIEVLIFNAW